MRGRSYLINATMGVPMLCLVAPPVQAQTAQRYDITDRELAAALQRFATVSGHEVVAASAIVANKRSVPVTGMYTAAEALTILISEADLRFDVVDGAFVIRPLDVDRGEAGQDEPRTDLVVTGTRIRGAPIASPVITVSNETMRTAGQSNLGDVVRSIPQTFSGGQNPGVGGNVPGASGINVGSASTINLRGLGSDATLTLLNGHRLTYNGTRQGIDVASLPIALVDRIEIVPDGASAIYGSDAVAGVANIILKRDYDGLDTRAEVGGATDGGAFEQQYSGLAGTRWSSGGIVGAYEFARNTDIQSNQRSFAVSRPGVTIYPDLRRHAFAFAAHQSLTDRIEFTVDALFNRRWSSTAFPLNFAGDPSVSRTEQDTTSRSLAIAPSLILRTDMGWRFALSGTYGDEKVELQSNNFTGDTLSSGAFVCYCNKGASAELAADGRLFALPGGFAKIALGTGYRYNLLDAFRAVGDINNIRRSQDSFYVYGEADFPLVGPRNDLAAINRLNLTAALRYERYPGVDAVAVPKFGLIYAPTPDLGLKASWGKSFRVPTLFQQYQVRSALLYPAASLGGSTIPAGATALVVQGGNASVTAERAQSWTATLDLHPRALDGLRAQLSYFSTRYTDRIVTPIAFQALALSSPLYADQVTRAPTAATVNATIAAAAQFFNVSGSAFDPAAVVAIVDNTNLNAGRQRFDGVDLLVDYQTAIGRDGTLTASVNVSYLDSDQQLTAGAPILERAGTLFNPPRWRGRGTLSWSDGPLTFFTAINVIGGVDDIRSTPPVRVAGTTSVDFTARYVSRATEGPLRGTSLSLRLLNAFNAKPERIATTLYLDSAYDSTNYSPIGRFIGVGVAKSW